MPVKKLPYDYPRLIPRRVQSFDQVFEALRVMAQDLSKMRDMVYEAVNVNADNTVLPSYTVATLPSASANPQRLVYVSDESGGPVPVFSDGTNWRRVTDRAIVS